MPEREHIGETIADWLEQETGRPVSFGKIEPGDEQILPGREQRELDRLPSILALRKQASR